MPAPNQPPLEEPAPLPTPSPEAVLEQLARLMGHLAVELLPLGLAVGDMERLLAKHYVEVAAESLGGTDDTATTCGIAIATGLSRHRVNQLRHKPAQGMRTCRMNRAQRVAAGWLADPAYHPDPGAPLPPPVRYVGKQSFCALVRRHSGDIPPSAMRKFMVEAGMLEVTGDGSGQLLWLKARPQDATALRALSRKLATILEVLET